MEYIINIKDAASIALMSTGDKVIAGLMVAFIGMSFTFILLILLWLFISLLSKVTMDKKPAVVKEPDVAVDNALGKIPSTPENDLDIVAAIAAAISEFTGEEAETFRIKSIVRKQSEKPAWISQKYSKIGR